jgi:hypothetical protein
VYLSTCLFTYARYHGIINFLSDLVNNLKLLMWLNSLWCAKISVKSMLPTKSRWVTLGGEIKGKKSLCYHPGQLWNREKNHVTMRAKMWVWLRVEQVQKHGAGGRGECFQKKCKPSKMSRALAGSSLSRDGGGGGQVKFNLITKHRLLPAAPWVTLA